MGEQSFMLRNKIFRHGIVTRLRARKLPHFCDGCATIKQGEKCVRYKRASACDKQWSRFDGSKYIKKLCLTCYHLQVIPREG